jgi:hypothetical protein
MVSSEVQRTLVKSPPELWAELSNPTSLARHLGELGEIRITRTEPETTVEWEGENINGVVSIKASGWGTKVTLSVTREHAPATPEAQSEDAQHSGEEQSSDRHAQAGAAEQAATSEPTTPKPRRGFFARLFRHRRSAEPTPPPERTPDAFVAISQALAAERLSGTRSFDPLPATSFGLASDSATGDALDTPMDEDAQELQATQETSAQDDSPNPTGDLSAELIAMEEVAAEEVTAVLTAVLDRLGAAHHRPFSRA